MNKQHVCSECRYFFADQRVTPYQRDPMFFCKRKGVFASRNYAVHEKNRILKDDPACSLFSPK